LKGCGPGSNLKELAAFIIQFGRVSDSGREGVRMLLETRIWIGTFHIYFKKWFFGLQNSVVPFGKKGKKLFCQL
jgi:hypothetical protein